MIDLNQKIENLTRAVEGLRQSVATPPTEDRDLGGILKAFETAYELTWKVLKSILQENGIQAPFPRVAFEEAFKAGLLEGNSIWKEIIEDRNLSVHVYDKAMATRLYEKIKSNYVEIFEKTLSKIKASLRPAS